MMSGLRLTVAIDFDDTFTSDVKTWSNVIEILIAAGHRVICVSARSEHEGNRRELESALPSGVPVLLSYHTQKSEFAQSQGYQVDIWIDDIPSAIPTEFELNHAVKFVKSTKEFTAK